MDLSLALSHSSKEMTLVSKGSADSTYECGFA